MTDPRLKKLARLIVTSGIDAKKGENVWIRLTGMEGSPLVRELYKLLIKLESNVDVDVSFPGVVKFYYDNATEEMLKRKPEMFDKSTEWADSVVTVVADDNNRELSEVDPRKVMIKQKVARASFDKILKKKWTLAYYPTNSMAQSAEMSLEDLEDFYFKACLQDYTSIHKRLLKLKKILDNSKELHIQGYQTDIKMSFKGRYFLPDTGKLNNIPAGEIFGAPLDHSTQGHIFYEFPSSRMDKEIKGIRLTFEKGRVVKYSAEKGLDYLEASLNTDAGAKRFGELGIGANYGIRRFMNNTLFDEKIGGTIHTALGRAYDEKEGGGSNKSAIHWDIVKDMGSGLSGMDTKNSTITVDGKVILRDGKLLV